MKKIFEQAEFYGILLKNKIMGSATHEGMAIKTPTNSN